MPIRNHAARPQDPVVRQLTDDLWKARYTVVELMPEAAQAILRSYYDCVTELDTYRWLAEVADDLIQLVEPLPPRSAHQIGERALCPLCGNGAQTPYEQGFAFPEGLRMHLEGKGKAHPCSVVEAAQGLADHQWDEQFGPRGSRERQRLTDSTEARRQREIQFLTHPYKPPRLVDEGDRHWTARDAKGLEWAGERLISMGFRLTAKRKIKAYIKETPNAAVYADPRIKGAISFVVILKPVTEDLDYWQQRRVPTQEFRIQDGRIHGLVQVVEQAVADAIRTLSPGLKVVK